jgi:hypothetical protein
MAVEFKRGRKWQDEDLTPYIMVGSGYQRTLLPLPNAEDVDPMEFLNNLAAVGHGLKPVWGYARSPRSDGNLWTQFFLNDDGGGYAVSYGGTRYLNDKPYATPIVRRFTICKHEIEEGPGANHSRGWHPGHCRLCGVDTSYDSGD